MTAATPERPREVERPVCFEPEQSPSLYIMSLASQPYKAKVNVNKLGRHAAQKVCLLYDVIGTAMDLVD